MGKEFQLYKMKRVPGADGGDSMVNALNTMNYIHLKMVKILTLICIPQLNFLKHHNLNK